MNKETNITQTETEIPATLTSGQQLRKAREDKNFTQDEIAKQLLLSKEIIAALENDDYSKIIAPVYTRGYLVAYARLLQLSPETILKEFKHSTNSTETTNSTELHSLKTLHPIKIGTNQEQHSPRWTIYTAIAILVIAAFVWLYNHHKHTVLTGVTSPKNIESVKTNMDTNDNFTLPSTLNVNKPIEQESFTTPSLSQNTSVAKDAEKKSQITSNIEILSPAVKPNNTQEKKDTFKEE